MRGALPWIAVVAAAALFAADAREASACTPLPGGVYGRTTLPEDGAVDVPLNARVYVLYDTHGGDPGSTLELREQGGATIALTSTTPLTIGFARLLAPSAPLAPSTTYEVVDTLTLPCDEDEASLCLGAPAVIATFTTGTALDTTAPQLTGVSVDSSFSCVADSCPEGENEQVDDISVGGRVDDYPTTWVQYEYLSPDGEVLAGPTSWTVLGRGCGGGAGYVPFQIFLYMPSTVEMRAVDLAGNVEATTHPIAGGTCDLVSCGPDAGPGASDDGGAGGCGCATGSGHVGDVAVVLAALMLARRRRRP